MDAWLRQLQSEALELGSAPLDAGKPWVDDRLPASGGMGSLRPSTEAQLAAHPTPLGPMVHKVAAQVNPALRVSRGAAAIIGDVGAALVEALAIEAKAAACMRVGKTASRIIGRDDLLVAVRLLLPGELAKHAIAEGRKAVRKVDMHDSDT